MPNYVKSYIHFNLDHIRWKIIQERMQQYIYSIAKQTELSHGMVHHLWVDELHDTVVKPSHGSDWLLVDVVCEL